MLMDVFFSIYAFLFVRWKHAILVCRYPYHKFLCMQDAISRSNPPIHFYSKWHVLWIYKYHCSKHVDGSSSLWKRNFNRKMHVCSFVFNSSHPGQNGRYFADDIFWCIVVNNSLILNNLSLKFAPKFVHMKSETKWPPFKRRHIQIHFLEWKCMNFD